MVVEKIVNILINSRNITYYRNLGYNLYNPNNYNIIEVKIEDLNINSRVKIHAICNL